MKAFNRLYGVKPGPDAPRLERLLWFRRYYFINFFEAVLVVVVLVALVNLSPWFALILLIPLSGYARLEWEIRKVKAGG